MPEPYAPHVAVAFRDLSKEGYEKGFAYLQQSDYQDTITLSHVALVERTPRGDVEYKRFVFEG